MDKPKSNKLYIFQWPSNLGGADTKLVSTLPLLSSWMDITVVPNNSSLLSQTQWTVFLDRLGIKYIPIEELPNKDRGFCLSMSNDRFFTGGLAKKAKSMGLYTIWGSEMMWHHSGELEAIGRGEVDHVLYTSLFNKIALAPGYGDLPYSIIDNYVDPDKFYPCYRDRKFSRIGRVSRDDPEKYPVNFPLFYENLSTEELNFMVMGWGPKTKEFFKWHSFDTRWLFYSPSSIPTVDFYRMLDAYVYPLGHRFRESYGRTVVEAMLTGLPVIVPEGHNFGNLVKHGETGYLCSEYKDYVEAIEKLRDVSTYSRISEQAKKWAKTGLCDKRKHTQQWKDLFGVKK